MKRTFKPIFLGITILFTGINPLMARRANSSTKQPQKAPKQVKQYKTPLQQLLGQKTNFHAIQDDVRIDIKQFNQADCRHYLKTSKVLKTTVPLHIHIVNNSPCVWVLSEKELDLHLASNQDVQRVLGKKAWGSFFKGILFKMGFSFLAYPATYFMGSIFWGGAKDAITFGDCAKAGLLAAPWAVVKEGIPAIADNYRIKKDMKNITLETTWDVHPYTTANILVFAEPDEFSSSFDMNLYNKRHNDTTLTFNVVLA